MADLRAMLAPLARRIMMMVGRGVVRGSTDDTGRLQVQVELLRGELRDAIEVMQQYGFASRPLDGADAGVVFVGGNREHGIAFAVDDRRYRLQVLAKGEVAIYTDEGDKIHLKRGGTVEVVAATKVQITAPDVELSGNLSVGGQLDVTGAADFSGQVRHNGTRIDSTHRHSGVQSGGSNTGTVT